MQIANETLVPITNLSFPYASGCLASYSSTSVLNISTGQVRDSTDAFDIVVNSTLTVSTAFVGAGGLDTGTIAANTMYAVFVIFDPTYNVPVSTLLSKSSTAPVLPSKNGTTYGAFRLVGFWLTDGSANLLKGYTCGASNDRYFQYDAPIVALNAGSSASANVDLSVAVPVTNFGNVKMQSIFTPHAAADTASIKPVNATANAYVIYGIVASVQQSDLFSLLPLITSSKPEVTYTLSSTTSPAALTLSVVGYDFYI